MMTLSARPSEPLARRDLWLSLAIGVTFACYHIVTAMTWSGPVETFRAYSLFSTGLTLVIFALLWIGYRRWREADRHRRELQSIMRSLTTEAIMVVDPGRRVQACNDAVQGLFGRLPEEVVGLLTDALYDDRRADKSQPGEIWHALEKYGSHRGRARGRRRRERVEARLDLLLQGVHAGAERGLLLLRHLLEAREEGRDDALLLAEPADLQLLDVGRQEAAARLRSGLRRRQLPVEEAPGLLDAERAPGGHCPLPPGTPRFGVSVAHPAPPQAAARALFAEVTRAAKPFGSWKAISARTLRFTSEPAFFSPATSCE